MNYYLLKSLSKKEPVCTHNRNENHFIVCGSILSESNEKTTVWGAGFGHSEQRCSPNAEVLAVRGHLSREIIEKDIPVGDPALLMPKFYNPQIQKKHRYGIIPHWKDLERILFLNHKELFVISPLQPLEKVIDDILSCENVLSSSLHGLILSDAYKVPNQWIDFGTDVGGDGFKFKDYYSTTDLVGDSVNNIRFDKFQIASQEQNIDILLKSCPFYE